LVEYADRLNSGSLSSRFGYLLDLLHQTPVEGLQSSRGPARLDPRLAERGEFHSRWRLVREYLTRRSLSKRHLRMLTPAQSQRLGQRNTIDMRVEERDCVQHLLHLLFNRPQDLILKVSTALRIVYHGGRCSESLDLSCAIGVEVIKVISACAEKRWMPRARWSLPHAMILAPSSSLS